MTRVNWPTGAWIVLDIEMMSSQGGGDADFKFDLRLSKNTNSRNFSIKDEQFAARRFPTVPAVVPPPGPPEKFISDILKKSTAFNYDDAVLTSTIISGMGGIDHRNLGLQHSNRFFFDVRALRAAANLSENAKLKINFIPQMDFTENVVGGSAATPIEWVMPAYIFRWVGIEDGIAMDIYDHTDYNYLIFPTKEAAVAFGLDWFSASTKSPSNPLYPGNYPNSGPVGSQWSGARIMDTADYNTFQRGGPATAPEHYGDMYSCRVQVRTYKSLKDYYLEKEEFDGNGYAYDDVAVHGKFVDLYEYKIAIWLDGYEGVKKQIIQNRSLLSQIVMDLPASIPIEIDKDLEITGPESPDDNPDIGGDGPR